MDPKQLLGLFGIRPELAPSDVTLAWRFPVGWPMVLCHNRRGGGNRSDTHAGVGFLYVFVDEIHYYLITMIYVIYDT